MAATSVHSPERFRHKGSELSMFLSDRLDSEFVKEHIVSSFKSIGVPEVDFLLALSDLMMDLVKLEPSCF